MRHERPDSHDAVRSPIVERVLPSRSHQSGIFRSPVPQLFQLDRGRDLLGIHHGPGQWLCRRSGNRALQARGSQCSTFARGHDGSRAQRARPVRTTESPPPQDSPISTAGRRNESRPYSIAADTLLVTGVPPIGAEGYAQRSQRTPMP